MPCVGVYSPCLGKARDKIPYLEPSLFPLGHQRLCVSTCTDLSWVTFQALLRQRLQDSAAEHEVFFVTRALGFLCIPSVPVNDVKQQQALKTYRSLYHGLDRGY